MLCPILMTHYISLINQVGYFLFGFETQSFLSLIVSAGLEVCICLLKNKQIKGGKKKKAWFGLQYRSYNCVFSHYKLIIIISCS